MLSANPTSHIEKQWFRCTESPQLTSYLNLMCSIFLAQTFEHENKSQASKYIDRFVKCAVKPFQQF